MASCRGPIPTRIREHLEHEKGCPGGELLSLFGGPPYGYYPDVVRACVLGLLRANQVKLRPASGAMVTGIRDAGCQDLFLKIQSFRRAEIFPVLEGEGVTARDRVALQRFFEETMGLTVPSENEELVNAIFDTFPGLAGELREFHARLDRLRPVVVPLPEPLERLQGNLEKARQRQVIEALTYILSRLDELRNGLRYLRDYAAALTEEAVEVIKRAKDRVDHHLAQLREIGLGEELVEVGGRLESHLAAGKPWEGLPSLEADTAVLELAYRSIREELLRRHSQAVEHRREALQSADGFHKLNQDEAQAVLRPFRAADCETTPEATYPSLLFLRDTLPTLLEKAARDAQAELDRLLAEKEELQTTTLDLGLKGEIVATPEDVERLLERLRERLLQQLKNKVRVRLGPT